MALLPFIRKVTVYSSVFLREEPVHRRNGENTMWEFPTGDISFLFDIPAMRSGKTIPELGPEESAEYDSH